MICIYISVFRFNWTYLKLDCGKADYKVDEAVLIGGYIDPTARPCPISGGFQLLMNLGESPSSENCLGSVSSYLPQLLFQCDETGSTRAIIDLGKLCTPQVLRTSQSLRGRYVAHLKCLASWQENKGSKSSEFTTVLLVMRDSYLSYWCLHLQRLNGKTSGEVLYKAILTLDGRCLPDISGSLDSPKHTDMFGKLVSFKPGNDTECKDHSYMSSCEEDDGADTCRESLRCPSSCGRCKKSLKLKSCAFPMDIRGSWESLSFDEDSILSVGKNTVQSPQFGQFQCQSAAEDGDVKGMYPMVQVGIEPTCWPYYSCAEIRSLAPGLLSFQMRPALKNIYTGKVESCQETHRQVWSIRPEKAEETKTLIDRKRLKPTPCRFKEAKAYPSIGLIKGCLLVVPECSGTCNTFNISLEANTCNNISAESVELYTQHICMARVSFDDGAHVVLTKIVGSEEDSQEFRCWLFFRFRLYILRADYCNQNQIESIFEFDDHPEFTYDPVYNLIVSKTMSAGRSGRTVAELNLIVVGLVLLSWLTVFY